MKLFESPRSQLALHLFEASEEPIFAVNAQGIVRGSCNPAALNASQRLGKPALFPEGDYHRLLGCLDTVSITEVRGQFDGQSAVWICRPLPLSDEVIVCCSTEQARLRDQATTDPLTGLANKAEFLRDLSTASLVNTGLNAFLVSDLDSFRAFNNQYGHAVGDELLIQVGEVLRSQIRSGDKCYRYGGEELVVRMSGLINNLEFSRAIVRSRAVAFASAVRQIKLNGIDHQPVTTTIGIVMFPSDDCDLDARHKEADTAAYFGKETGRDRICFYDEVPADWLAKRLAAVGK